MNENVVTPRFGPWFFGLYPSEVSRPKVSFAT